MNTEALSRAELIAEARRVRVAASAVHTAAIAAYDAEMARIKKEYPA